jgi:UDPglucose 6-dehydrogenase
LDHQIGEAFLQAGVGWGGTCFPKDVAALAAMAEDYGYDSKLLNAVGEVNAKQRLVVVQKLQERLKILKGKTVGLLGLAFRPGTDDLRDAPVLAEEADALVLVTEWPEFQALPFEVLARLMRTPLIVDGRICLDREAGDGVAGVPGASV